MLPPGGLHELGDHGIGHRRVAPEAELAPVSASSKLRQRDVRVAGDVFP